MHTRPAEERTLSFEALRKGDGKYILNGNFVVSMFSKEIKIKGSVLGYSGSNNILERINSTRMIQEDIDLLVSLMTLSLILQ